MPLTTNELSIPLRAINLLMWRGHSSNTKELYHPDYGKVNFLQALFIACDYKVAPYRKYCDLVLEVTGKDNLTSLYYWENRATFEEMKAVLLKVETLT